MTSLAVNILAASAILLTFAAGWRGGYSIGKDVGHERARREQLHKEHRRKRAAEYVGKFSRR